MTEGSRRDRCFSPIGKKDTTQDKCQVFFQVFQRGWRKTAASELQLGLTVVVNQNTRRAAVDTASLHTMQLCQGMNKTRRRTKSTIYYNFFPVKNISHCIYIDQNYKNIALNRLNF